MRSLRTIGLFLLGLSLVSCQNDSPSFQAYSLSGFTMGTTYSVKVVSALPVNTNALISDIDRRLTEINASMSTYLPDSELSRINQSRTSNWITLSDELFTVLKAANEVSDKSNGAFDITVGPLINLWGFGPAGKAGVIPTDREIKSVMEYTGYEKLLLDTERKALISIFLPLPKAMQLIASPVYSEKNTDSKTAWSRSVANSKVSVITGMAEYGESVLKNRLLAAAQYRR